VRVPVKRRCRVCDQSIRDEVAYTRLVGLRDESSRRVYVHGECFFAEVPEDEMDRYQREVLTEEPTAQAGSSTGASTSAGESSRREAEPVIEVDGLAKVYPDGTEAVRGVEFEVRSGEIFGILGPNGAGKSTLIGMLGTLVKPSEGQGSVAGVDVVEDPGAVKPKLGFAMQEVGVDSLATGREYLELQARLYGLGRDQARERSQELLELFGIADAAEKRIDAYSGGMKRRVDLAAALIHEPEIVFLDEPTEGLDPRARREMWERVHRLNRELGATILLSTHYMEEADALCDRLAVLDEGDIVVEGSPEALKAEVGEQAILLEYDGLGDDRAQQAEALIRRKGLAEDVERSHNEVRAFVDDPGRSTPREVRDLETAGLGPASLQVQNATLDDVYLAYTGRSLEQAQQEAKA
jgi:ABC-2 type transport system ATP-binding protein